MIILFYWLLFAFKFARWAKLLKPNTTQKWVAKNSHQVYNFELMLNYMCQSPFFQVFKQGDALP